MGEFDNRFRVPTDEASTIASRAAERGDLYLGQIDRPSVAVNSTFYWLVTAGAKDVILTLIDPKFNLSSVLAGSLLYRTDIFLRDSTKNDYVYSGGTANASFGTPVNGYYVNQASKAQLSAGGTVSTLTGNPDYVITDANYFLATQGNANSSSGTQNNIFDTGMYIVLPAGTTALFRSVSSGTATGTLGVNTAVLFYERNVGN